MATQLCSIAITGVVGAKVSPLPPGQPCATYVTVTGVVYSPPGSPPCERIDITIDCSPNGMGIVGSVDVNGVLTGAAQPGSFLSGMSWSVKLLTPCCCGSGTQITATCLKLNCTTHQSIDLHCPNPCCPTIGMPQVTYGPCDAQGKSSVTINIPVTPGPPAACPPITNFLLYFGDGQTQTYSISGAGSITATHQYSAGSYWATLVNTTLEGCPQVQIPITVECDPKTPCPEFSELNYKIGACNYDGSVSVTGGAWVSLASGSTTVQWFVDGSPIPPAIVINAPGGQAPLSYSMTGDGQTHSLTLQVVGKNCAPLSATLTLPKCDPCPPIKFQEKILDCNKDGTRNVVVEAHLVGPTASTLINAQMVGPFGTVYNQGTGSLTIVSPVFACNTGTITVTVIVGGCQQSYSFFVKDCCPDVQFDVRFCDPPVSASGKCTRKATFLVTVTPQPGTSVQAELRDSATGTVIDNGYSSGAPFELHGWYDYDPGTNPQVEVVFQPPLDKCKATTQFCVPDCQDLWCTYLFSSTSVLLSGALGLLVLMAISAIGQALLGGPAWLVILLWNVPTLQLAITNSLFTSALGLVSLLAILVLAYWWLCKIFGVKVGSCCGTMCLFRVIMWQVPLMIAIMLILAMPASFLLTILFAIVLLALAFVLWLIWRKKCCPGYCDGWYYLALAVTFAYSTYSIVWFWAGVSITGPGFAFIPWMNTLWQGAHSAYPYLVAACWLAWGVCLAACPPKTK